MALKDLISKNKNIKKYLEKSEQVLSLNEDFIDTGVLTLNILYSGKLFGGIPKHKISMIAGKTQQGKSLQSMYLIKNAINKGMDVIFIDTESALNEDMLKNSGVDKYVNDKLIIIPENDITNVKQFVASLKEELSFEDMKNTLLVIDSWGGLINAKVLDDATSGKDVADLQTTRAKNSLANILATLSPMTVFVSNHTYESIGSFIPTPGGEISGGSKIQYFASAIVKTTSAKKDKTGDSINGKIVTAVAEKGRYVKPGIKKQYLIDFTNGIDRYYGILDDALEGGYVDKPSNGWYTRSCVENDKKWREKEIIENAEEFWKPIFENTDFPKYIEAKYKLGGKFEDSTDLEN